MHNPAIFYNTWYLESAILLDIIILKKKGVENHPFLNSHTDNYFSSTTSKSASSTSASLAVFDSLVEESSEESVSSWEV